MLTLLVLETYNILMKVHGVIKKLDNRPNLGSTELSVLILGKISISKRFQQKIFKINLLRTQSLAQQDFQ